MSPNVMNASANETPSLSGFFARLRDRLLPARRDGWSPSMGAIILAAVSVLYVVVLMVASTMLTDLKLTTNGWYVLWTVLALAVVGAILVWVAESITSKNGNAKAALRLIGGGALVVAGVEVLLLESIDLSNYPLAATVLLGILLLVAGIAAFAAIVAE